MVFSSVPLYLDPPSWTNHHHQHQQGDVVDGTTTGCSSLLPPPPPLPGGGGSARPPGSMTERARLAKVAPPEAALKCPRCDSTNTKFCYFNNYSLSQPRHFCKTCRRYWTRGGALRNVPVGGGCRRNKRSSKGSRSKSPAARADHHNGAPPSSARSPADIILSAANHFQPPPPISFLPPLQSLGGFGAAAPELGLNFSENEMGFHQMGNNSAVATMNLSARFADLFRLQQGMTPLPFLSGLDQPGGALYQFEEADQYGGDHHYHHHHQLGGKGFESGGGGGGATFHHVKMEGNNNVGMNSNMSRNFLGITGNNNEEHFWTGNNNVNGFTTTTTTTSDLPIAGYTSSSTTTASRLL
ncbi:unnamed protein product [Cuscuta campestris]|uniref:Dof zinc finger protein n=1 Tax=Cuscuta campestris TaxID=132261 RepID=A0A484N0Z3_9ASTE|nr:unnamed protein product [Cuscuta campestris]